MSIASIGHQPPWHQAMHSRIDHPRVDDGQENRQRTGFAGHLAARMMGEMDGNGDKQLCLCESGLSEDAFNGIDGNGDGLLTGREIASGLRDNHNALAAELSLVRPEGEGAPETDRPRPGARRARMRQAVASYAGSMADLMAATFEPIASTSSETATQESLDVAV